VQYASSERSSLFEIEVGQVDCGAYIGAFSQYADEEEHVLGPLSHFEITGRRREHGTNVYSLRLNINLNARTLEELRENRRCSLLHPHTYTHTQHTATHYNVYSCSLLHPTLCTLHHILEEPSDTVQHTATYCNTCDNLVSRRLEIAHRTSHYLYGSQLGKTDA